MYSKFVFITLWMLLLINVNGSLNNDGLLVMNSLGPPEHIQRKHAMTTGGDSNDTNLLAQYGPENAMIQKVHDKAYEEQLKNNPKCQKFLKCLKKSARMVSLITVRGPCFGCCVCLSACCNGDDPHQYVKDYNYLKEYCFYPEECCFKKC